MTTYTFTGAVAYDRLGSSWRTAAGLRSVSVTDPATGLLPANLIQGGVAVTWLTADANSRYSFTCDVPGVVVDFGAGAEALYANEVPGLAIAAGAPNVTRWSGPGTTYALGQQVVSPNSDVVKANVAHTSAAAYATDVAKWDLSTTYVAGVMPEKYGAVGDGVTDDTTALASALAAGTVVLLDPAKTYLTTQVSIPAGKTLRSMNGGRATIKAAAGIACPVVLVEGSGSTLEGVRVDGNRANQTTNVMAVNVNSAAGTVSNVTVRDNEITNAKWDSIRVSGTVNDSLIEDNYIHDCDNHGITVQAVAANRLTIRGNRIRQVALVANGCSGIQVYSATPIYTNLTVHGNNISDLGATGIPIELTGAQKFAITDNIITGVGTRGISMGGLFDGVVSGNSIHGQSTYGVELNTLTRVNIVGNTIVNCCAGMSGQAGSDLLITGNFIAYTTAAGSNPYGVFLQAAISKRVTIQGNYFLDLATCAVKINNASEDVTVQDNVIVYTSTASLLAGALIAISIYGWQRGRVEGNTIHTALAGTGGVGVGLIYVNGTGSLDVRIRRNVLRSTTGANLAIGGITTGAYAAVGLRVEDNEIMQLGDGVRTLNLTNDDVFVSGNQSLTCTTPENLKAAHIRRTKIVYEATAAPTAGTWRVGDIVWNSTPAASGIPGWMCVTAGTPGTWKAMAALAA